MLPLGSYISCGARQIATKKDQITQTENWQGAEYAIKQIALKSTQSTYILADEKNDIKEKTPVTEIISYIKKNKLGNIYQTAPIPSRKRNEKGKYHQGYIWLANTQKMNSLRKKYEKERLKEQEKTNK